MTRTDGVISPSLHQFTGAVGNVPIDSNCLHQNLTSTHPGGGHAHHQRRHNHTMLNGDLSIGAGGGDGGVGDTYHNHGRQGSQGHGHHNDPLSLCGGQYLSTDHHQHNHQQHHHHHQHQHHQQQQHGA